MCGQASFENREDVFQLFTGVYPSVGKAGNVHLYQELLGSKSVEGIRLSVPAEGSSHSQGRKRCSRLPRNSALSNPQRVLLARLNLISFQNFISWLCLPGTHSLQLGILANNNVGIALNNPCSWERNSGLLSALNSRLEILGPASVVYEDRRLETVA